MCLPSVFRVMLASATILAGTAVVPSAMAGDGAPVQQTAAPLPNPDEIELDAASPAVAKSPESWSKLGDKWTVANVSQPTLTPFFPAEGTANGTAVVIAPGGGFMMLSMESEGYEVAKWLAANGITAFVLKYRLLDMPTDPNARMKEMMRRITTPSEFPRLIERGTAIAVEDAREAMRVVRANAAAWSVDPDKVGFMGFSAGAFTTLALVNQNDPATMPAFVAPIYGPMGTPAEPLPANLPPMWVSLASDDPLFGRSDFGLITAWQKNGGAVELHLYEKGGHGYGFAGAAGTTTVHWPEQFLSWLRARGLAPNGRVD